MLTDALKPGIEVPHKGYFVGRDEGDPVVVAKQDSMGGGGNPVVVSTQDSMGGGGNPVVVAKQDSMGGGGNPVVAVSYTHLTLPTIYSV